jgi:phosphoribosylanthranilate isomerase
VSARNELLVKICGLRDVASAQASIDAGADALGFILAPSKRQVTSELVGEIRRLLVLSPTRPQMIVGVTVNASPDAIRHAVETAGLDAVQLSGDESPSILDDLDVPVIKALRFADGTSLDTGYAELDAWYAAPRPVTRVIIEGYRAGSYGGTGTAADWEFAAALAARYPIILAGGLSPENVAEAVTTVLPSGVDVSSGVETDGAKDTDKIGLFIRRARAAAGSSGYPEA